MKQTPDRHDHAVLTEKSQLRNHKVDESIHRCMRQSTRVLSILASFEMSFKVNILLAYALDVCGKFFKNCS